MAEPGGGGPTIGRVKVEFVGDNTKLKQTAAESKRVAEGVGTGGGRAPARGNRLGGIRGALGLIGSLATGGGTFALGRIIRESVTGENRKTERAQQIAGAGLEGDVEELRKIRTELVTQLGILQGVDGNANRIFHLLQGFRIDQTNRELALVNILLKINNDFILMRKTQEHQRRVAEETKNIIREGFVEQARYSRQQLEQTAAAAGQLTWPFPIFGPR